MFYGFITHLILHVTVLQIYRISYIVQAAQIQEVVLKGGAEISMLLFYINYPLNAQKKYNIVMFCHLVSLNNMSSL